MNRISLLDIPGPVRKGTELELLISLYDALDEHIENTEGDYQSFDYFDHCRLGDLITKKEKEAKGK